MFTATISIGTDNVRAHYDTGEQLREAYRMMTSGVSGTTPWGLDVLDKTTGNTIAVTGASIVGSVNAVEAVLRTLSIMPARPLRPGEGVDVIVPVRLAMHGGQLVDAEDFVRGAVERALNDDAAAETVGMLGKRPEFSFNGDTVTPGSAKKDRS